MTKYNRLNCPVSECSFEGTLSRVIHHVTETSDGDHIWEVLGYDHSYQFRTQHTDEDVDTGESDEPEATDSDESRPLESVPGIGDTRARALREAGYTTVEDVAEASPSKLAAVRKLSDDSSRSIRATAQDVLQYDDTFSTRLAHELDVDRAAVADAYAELAGITVPPAAAKETLERLLEGGDADSVVNFSEYSLRYRHFLLEAGYERVDDVAEASVDELVEVPYFGEALAANVREAARDKLGQPTTTNGEDTEITAGAGEGDTKSLSDGKTGNALDVEVEAGTFPGQLTDSDRWLLWAEDEGRKIPRAPWETGEPLRYASAMEPANQVSFEEASEWQSKLPHGLDLAYVLTGDDDILFVDLDDTVVDGELTDAARRIVELADSYTAVSTSGTGLHVLVRGSLPEGVKSLTGPLTDGTAGSVEVYDRNRFVGMTGRHLQGTPTEVADGEALLEELEAELASVGTDTPDRTKSEPQRSREELRQMAATGTIQDIFDAIQQTRPADIRMRSTVEEERADGTYSYDPSWVQSDSGTRLAVLDDGWIYRQGMIALDALQVVALEEGIIHDERAYPEGEDFWEALGALRDRGANVPRYEPDREPAAEPGHEPTDETVDEGEIARRINYGDPVREYVDPYDRDYQEKLALELAPVVIDAADTLALPPAVAYRAAELYAIGHAEGIVPGAAHESTLGAALRIAAIEAGVPRPFDDIADAVGATTSSIQNKFQRVMSETNLSEEIPASELVPQPADFVPYVARKLEVADDDRLQNTVEELLSAADQDGGSNPISEVAAAFYVAMRNPKDYDATQGDVAYAVGLSKPTIRNNYRKYADER